MQLRGVLGRWCCILQEENDRTWKWVKEPAVPYNIDNDCTHVAVVTATFYIRRVGRESIENTEPLSNRGGKGVLYALLACTRHGEVQVARARVALASVKDPREASDDDDERHDGSGVIG